MATKKTNAQTTKPEAQKQEAKRNPYAIKARIDRLVDMEGSSLKAVASVNIGSAFAVHGIRIMDSQKGLFVSMPSTKYEKDGQTKYSDICHPISAESRTELNNAVLAAYEQKLEETEGEDQTEVSPDVTM